MSQQPVNVTVVNRGCGSGCGTILLILLALAAVGALIKYWYITVPIAIAVSALAIVVQNTAKKKTAATQGNARVIDTTATTSKPIPAQPAVSAPKSGSSEGQANVQDLPSERSPAFIADELAKLAQLRDSGVLTEEEFANEKRWLLRGGR